MKEFWSPSLILRLNYEKSKLNNRLVNYTFKAKKDYFSNHLVVICKLSFATSGDLLIQKWDKF